VAEGRVIDVEAILDNQRFGAFSLRVLALALLALIADGYDVQVMAFSAPSLLKDWGLQRAAFGPVLSAGLFGILFGAPLFGWLGDRIGRKRCIILGSLLYGVFSLSCLLAANLKTLVALRFLTGVGLGGVMPNAIAIAAELSPRKVRAGMASVIAVGITIGGVAAGLIAAHIPAAGAWRTLFLVGGLIPFATALLIAVGLPESVAFLVRRDAPRERVVRLLRQVDPRLEIPADAGFTISREEAQASAGMGALFRGELKLVTPLLWLMFASTLLTIYLLTGWMPLLLEASGFTPARAAETNSLFQAGGVLGCVVVSLLLARLGPPLVAGLFLLTLASVAVVARAHLGDALPAGVAACGFCLIGLQATLNGTAGLAYPTAARAKGVGMALGVGRIGSVVGPLVGGQMVAAGVTSARDLFLLPLAPLAVGAASALFVAARLRRR
jgi:AAHS family 4-hydroxybenzoate transporter-like MFS transporter